jgi:hypothetical protein
MDPDPYQMEKQDPALDQYLSDKQDPDPYQKGLDLQHWLGHFFVLTLFLYIIA